MDGSGSARPARGSWPREGPVTSSPEPSRPCWPGGSPRSARPRAPRTLPVARAAIQGGATWLGVALVEEGLRLREAGIRNEPILLLSEFPAEAEKEVVAADLTPTVYSERKASALAAAARAIGRPARAHLKVDTGMHRVGVLPHRAVAVARALVSEGIE